MNGMQMPFPFNMFVPKAEDGQQTEENKNACPFPFMFNMMPQMPFQMNGMQMPCGMFSQTENAQSNPFAFLNSMMPQLEQMKAMFPMLSMLQSMATPFCKNGEKNEQNCIQMQGISVPVELIQKALQVTASPKALEMLQQILDLLFGMYTKDPGEAPKE
ncbi:MAG: hypothetical protein MJ118_07205 [Clostridia bacterium]|nr:hypothetical protein [Clostridia bacterium]